MNTIKGNHGNPSVTTRVNQSNRTGRSTTNLPALQTNLNYLYESFHLFTITRELFS